VDKLCFTRKKGLLLGIWGGQRVQKNRERGQNYDMSRGLLGKIASVGSLHIGGKRGGLFEKETLFDLWGGLRRNRAQEKREGGACDLKGRKLKASGA